MKKNLIAIGIAFVAIFTVHQRTAAQDATREQIAAEATRQKESDLQAALSAKKAAERLSMLTPEQVARQKLLLERIRALPLPPLPTNVPTIKAVRAYSTTSKAKASATPLSQGERMQLRNLIMTELLMSGTIGSQGVADAVNESIDILNSESTDPTTIAQSAEVLVSAFSGGASQSLMMSARTIDYTSDPYSFVNMQPFINGIQQTYPWYSSDSSDPSVYWISVPRTLVPTNGPAIRSGPFTSGRSDYAALRNPTIQNHYDTAGAPVRHILALNYKLENMSTVTGMDVAYIDIDIGISGAVPTTNHVHYTLPATTAWTRNVRLINSMAKTNPLAPSQGIGVRYYEFWAVVGKTHYFGRPVGLEPIFSIDPSIQWIPYWLQPIPGDFIIERIGNQILVQWSTISYQSSHFRLTFATSLQGPWSSSIGVPVTTTNEVSTAIFSANNPARFYRLESY